MATILAVDDDPTARDLLKTVLSYVGHDVREAHDGAQALEILNNLTPAVIIVDLLMPAMDGLEFVRHLRERPQTAAVPVIFYTAAYLQTEAQRLAKVSGVERIITKPAEPEQIIAAVNATLGENVALSPGESRAAQDEYLADLTAALSQKAAHVVPRLEAMVHLGLHLASERDPERLLADFCDATRRIVDARISAVVVQHNGEATPRYTFGSGLTAAGLDKLLSKPAVQAAMLAVRDSGRPSQLKGLVVDATLIADKHHAPMHSLLCARIQSPQRVYGSLLIAGRIGADAFSAEDEALAQTLASQVGRIYENGSLYREIRALNADLERRIEERTAQLLESNAELEAFAYTVSHDLRAPLRAISAYSAILVEEESGHLSDRGRRYLQTSIDSAQRLTHMVDDLLAFSRLGRKALRIQRLDLAALIREIWNESVVTYPHAELQLGELDTVCGDRAMLRVVWVNLISNALKYSSRNARPLVTIELQRAERELQFSIRDNGVGFDMAQADRLFRVFERLHAARDFEGTGAGLAIVERIIKRHGGRTWAESVPDQGATFHFTLPTSLAAEVSGRGQGEAP